MSLLTLRSNLHGARNVHFNSAQRAFLTRTSGFAREFLSLAARRRARLFARKPVQGSRALGRRSCEFALFFHSQSPVGNIIARPYASQRFGTNDAIVVGGVPESFET
jgi:hypothetical protein